MSFFNGGGGGQRITGRIVVTEGSQLGGTIDSTKEYYLDGIIDMAGEEITVPAGGLFISGINFDLSGLVNTANNEKLFVGANAGDVLFMNFFIEMSGAGSQVYDLTDDDGTHAIEIDRVNYNNCTSLGTASGYRQGLETGTGRFGGTPEMTLAGTWAGGFFIDVSIVRGLTAGAYSLFKAGASFSMASRFRSNQNIDLPTSASFFDFSPSNFVNPSTVQLDNCLVSRNFVFDSSDALLIPNMDAADLEAQWRGNTGIDNTFIGGESCITVTALTSLTMGVSAPVAGTYVASDLQHFDAPANGQLRHLGASPLEYKVQADYPMDGTAGDVLILIVQKSINDGSTWTDEITQTREVNNFPGPVDKALFNLRGKLTLANDDRIRIAVENTTSGNDVTAELDSCFDVEERQ